ncbi:hypothetical protein GCM10012287_55250 [Streptomyces daqingensis]|uniref:Phospholipase D-like domain-containing protein n=1 Tax=Streptomyces daqingensis TaxID=1472640 RepID=A0ABQ2MT27_9ACTN|nr:hypothetical protein [Streptomyces daqingensis]GGO58029.1 hypothetical protein GCM10012287_55250 [Streptomyces daqingensis]
MFGTGVLSGLVDGIDEYRAGLERQPYRSRSLGPALLGAFHRLDDEELVERIAGYPAACVVIRDEPHALPTQVELLRDAAKRSAGFPAGALPGLPGLALAAKGRPPVAGPASPMADVRLSALRTLGGASGEDEGDGAAPALHTKMLMVGELWWHDEATLGKAADVAEFTPHRLWLGSANGTARSRADLEFGLWLDDRGLLETARQFMVQLLARSEDWNPDGAAPAPGLTAQA